MDAGELSHQITITAAQAREDAIAMELAMVGALAREGMYRFVMIAFSVGGSFRMREAVSRESMHNLS
ncbi:hypothetical protein HCX48_13005 [Rhodocyclus tenuis]|uniref:Uncharacterized protein n=1 Tax=Rhodocyclus gracilis TaxID=2929842 RepID=A0ABX0WK90_9RHOO|nr:hypothetical protein [Rhodocyclus gracilis]NJA90132.1 hypothetical protein [Rhodocyclus gracilis]